MKHAIFKLLAIDFAQITKAKTSMKVLTPFIFLIVALGTTHIQAHSCRTIFADTNVASTEIFSIPEQLHIFSDGRPLNVKIRNATLAEVNQLLKSDESGEHEINISRFWKKNPASYYRWDLKSEGELGLINDITKEVTMYAIESRGAIDPEALPRVVTTEIDGRERIVAFGSSYGGDVKFHADFTLRNSGYSGLRTIIVADYLRWCLQNKAEPRFDAVNSSYGFYEKIGFLFSNAEITPAKSSNPAGERFPMHMPVEKIPEALRQLLKRDQNRL